MKSTKNSAPQNTWYTVCGKSCIKLHEHHTHFTVITLFLSTGWFQELIRAWFHNWTKTNWGPYGRLY